MTGLYEDLSISQIVGTNHTSPVPTIVHHCFYGHGYII